MATVKFYIRKSTAQDNDHGVIFLKYFDRGEQFTDTLDYEFPCSNWDSEKGRLFPLSKREEVINLNLGALATKILKIRLGLVSYDDNGNSSPPSANDVKEAYLGLVKPKPVDPTTLIDLIPMFLDEKKLAGSTEHNYKSTVKHLERFTQNDKYKRVSIVLSDIDGRFFAKLQSFYTDQKVLGGMELDNSTTNKHMGCIKSALRHFKGQYGINIDLLDKVDDMDTGKDVFFCTYEELEHLKLIKFGDPVMDLVAKLYVFACYAPARLGDLRKMGPQHIKKDYDKQGTAIQTLDFISGKTGVHTIIALNKYCTSLIAEMDAPEGRLLSVPERGVAGILHKALRASGLFDDSVTVRTFRGDSFTEEIKPRWEALTFHSSRNTFATNMLSLDVSVRDVQIAMGHKKIETTMEYAALVKSEYYSSILSKQEGIEIQSRLEIVKAG